MIAVEQLRVTLGSFRLAGVSFAVPRGQYAVLMGPSGAGKTTLLEAICGLKPIAAGRIIIADRDATRARPGERGVGFVPQEAALFAAMSVRRHLMFGPAVHRWPADAIARRVDELADLLGLRSLLDRRPAELSGGERQRVALGRALAARPGVLCLDEPLSALDDAGRAAMHDLLRTVRDHAGVTTLHITHNRHDARRLADRVLLLDAGRVIEAPLEPDTAPAHAPDEPAAP